jgi:hypothetical protein
LRNLAEVMFESLNPAWVGYVLARSELTQSKAAASSTPEVMDHNLKDFFGDLQDVASFLAARANYMWALMPELLGGADRVTSVDYGFALYTLSKEHDCKDMILEHDKYIQNKDRNSQ